MIKGTQWDDCQKTFSYTFIIHARLAYADCSEKWESLVIKVSASVLGDHISQCFTLCVSVCHSVTNFSKVFKNFRMQIWIIFQQYLNTSIWLSLLWHCILRYLSNFESLLLNVFFLTWKFAIFGKIKLVFLWIWGIARTNTSKIVKLSDTAFTEPHK